MDLDNRAVVAETERQRQQAISNLRAVIDDAQRHIDMLELDMVERPITVGHSIAQQETTQPGFAALAATRHDVLLAVLRGEYSE